MGNQFRLLAKAGMLLIWQNGEKEGEEERKRHCVLTLAQIIVRLPLQTQRTQVGHLCQFGSCPFVTLCAQNIKME